MDQNPTTPLNAVERGYLIRETVEGVVDTGGALRLESSEVPSSHRWAIYDAVLESGANALGPLIVQIGRLGAERTIYRASSLAANSTLRLGQIAYLSERERVVVIASSSTAGDLVKLTLSGVSSFVGDQSGPVVVS